MTYLYSLYGQNININKYIYIYICVCVCVCVCVCLCVYTVYLKQAFVVLLMLLFIKHLTSVCQCKTASVIILFNLTQSLV